MSCASTKDILTAQADALSAQIADLTKQLNVVMAAITALDTETLTRVEHKRYVTVRFPRKSTGGWSDAYVYYNDTDLDFTIPGKVQEVWSYGNIVQALIEDTDAPSASYIDAALSSIIAS